VLAFAISWAIWIPGVIRYLQMQPTGLPLDWLVQALAGAYGPGIAALIVTAVIGGWAGVKALLSRFLIWRVNGLWVLAALLGMIPLQLIVVGLYALTGGALQSPDYNQVLFLPVAILAALPFGPLGEEPGWRGFALPRFLEQRPALTSGAIVGALRTAWHIPLFLVSGAALPQVTFGWDLPIGYLLATVATSILMTWVYQNTKGSLLLMVLFHAGVNSVPAFVTTLLIGTVPPGSIRDLFWLSIIVQWAAVLVIAGVYGAQSLRRGKPGVP
jgi:membrane protease YdiL (CAAX protease family)